MADCDWIILCDYAFPSSQNKLGMIGVFDVIWAASVPLKHDRAAVGFSIVGEPGENVTSEIQIIGPDGHAILKWKMAFTLPDAGSAQGSIEVRDLPLKDFGRHAIQIDLGEGDPKTAWFTLRQAQAPAGQ